MSGAAGHRPNARRRADSNATILQAAVQALVEHGYSGASTIMVQELAGVSRGRLLHYFPSRDALLVAAAQHVARVRIEEMERGFDTVPTESAGGVDRIDQAVDLLWSTFRQPYFWAAMELWMAARTTESLRDELVDNERRLGRTIEHVIATMFGPVHSSHPDFADVRELLFTSMRGVALTYALDRRDPGSDPHLELWRTLARRALTAGTR
ncbi:TetR/AcrR family transcriptional regulator [Mycolicibacterium anyangense]|nr:TetR/AcrR family transcriptional regulator [Mycolicibacterium anyangense]